MDFFKIKFCVRVPLNNTQNNFHKKKKKKNPENRFL